MPLVELPVRMWTGLSTDIKPTTLPMDVGYLFHETDTGHLYLWQGSQWILLNVEPVTSTTPGQGKGQGQGQGRP